MSLINRGSIQKNFDNIPTIVKLCYSKDMGSIDRVPAIVVRCTGEALGHPKINVVAIGDGSFFAVNTSCPISGTEIFYDITLIGHFIPDGSALDVITQSYGSLIHYHVWAEIDGAAILVDWQEDPSASDCPYCKEIYCYHCHECGAELDAGDHKETCKHFVKKDDDEYSF